MLKISIKNHIFEPHLIKLITVFFSIVQKQRPYTMLNDLDCAGGKVRNWSLSRWNLLSDCLSFSSLIRAVKLEILMSEGVTAAARFTTNTLHCNDILVEREETFIITHST